MGTNCQKIRQAGRDRSRQSLSITSFQDTGNRQSGIGIKDGLRLKKTLERPYYRPLGNIPKWKSIAYFQAYTLLKGVGGIG